MGCEPMGDDVGNGLSPDRIRPEDSFVIQVVGSRSTLEASRFELEGFAQDHHSPMGDPSKLVFRSRLPWSELINRSFDLKLIAADQVLDTLQVTPHACKRVLSEKRFADHVASGRALSEVYQVHVTRNFEFVEDTDYDHPLQYRCETYDDQDRKMVMHILDTHQEQRCDLPDRAGSEFKVTGTWKGQSVEWRPTLCTASLEEVQAGEALRLSLAGPFPQGWLQVELEHQFFGPRQAAPFAVDIKSEQATGPVTSASFFVERADAEFGNDESLRDQFIERSTGRWSIQSADYSKKAGRSTGELSLEAFDEDGNQLKIVGSYDMPLLRRLDDK